MPEIVVIVAIGLLMGAVVGLSLWRFEKKRADVATKENAQLKDTLQALRLELAEMKVERNTALEELASARDQLAEAQQTIERLQRQLQAQAAQLGEAEALGRQLDALREQLEEVRGRLAEAQQVNAELTTRLEEQRGQYEEKLALLENAREQLGQQFEQIANRLFEQKQQQFSRHSREQLEGLLKPWQVQLEQFRQRVDALHTQQTQHLGQLQGELSQLKQLNQTLAEEARALTRALKADSKAQGNWGELVLERLLDAAGLREGEEYVREASFDTDEGRLRPDVLIRLPEGKHIVIDAKVSLTAYGEAVNAADESARRAAARAHLASVKKHIETLGDRQYHQLDIGAPEFTLMFMPVEGAYLLALEQEPHLQEFAYRHNVAIVTPPTLLVTLKTVAHLWRLARRDEDVEKLLQEAGRLYDKFVGFLEAFEKVRKHLEEAQKAWEMAETRLQGRGGVIVKIDAIGKLGAKAKKRLPPEQVTRAALTEKGSD